MIGRIKGVFGKAPGAVTADRGYGEAKVDEALTELAVKTVVIPRKGKPSAARREVEHGRGGLRRLVNWRTGAQGRIFYFKRRYGLDRTVLDGARRRPNLVRARRAHPQQRQDRRARAGSPHRHRHRRPPPQSCCCRPPDRPCARPTTAWPPRSDRAAGSPTADLGLA
ncbi:MAG: hypothetical protein PHQ28_07445 [Mycobacterium sp.]|nr:hypothetical protein [Mycobacterium sp.]